MILNNFFLFPLFLFSLFYLLETWTLLSLLFTLNNIVPNKCLMNGSWTNKTKLWHSKVNHMLQFHLALLRLRTSPVGNTALLQSLHLCPQCWILQHLPEMVCDNNNNNSNNIPLLLLLSSSLRYVPLTKLIKARTRWVVHVAHMENRIGTYKVSVGTPDRKRWLQTSRHRWVNNIKMDPQEREGGGMDWVVLTQDRKRWWTLGNIVLNIRVP